MEIGRAQSSWMLVRGVTGLGAPKESPWLTLCLFRLFHGFEIGVGFPLAVRVIYAIRKG